MGFKKVKKKTTTLKIKGKASKKKKMEIVPKRKRKGFPRLRRNEGSPSRFQ